MRTHPSAEGTSTPITHALPSAPYDPVRLPHGPLPNTQRRSRDLRPRGSPPITRITLPPCHAHYPDGSNGCICRLLPRPPGLPRCSGGSASISSLSRPAQALLTLRPAGSLNRPRRPSSRGSGPASHPARSLVSYQINRQLSGWNLPPLVIRAFGTHGTKIEHPPTFVKKMPVFRWSFGVFRKFVAFGAPAAPRPSGEGDGAPRRRHLGAERSAPCPILLALPP